MTNTNQLFESAIAEIKADHESLNKLIDNQQDTEIGRFINRALDWRINNPHLFYELFHEVIDTSIHGFMGSFNSWVRNNLLDDSCFEIRWFKHISRDGNIVRVAADPSDLDYRVFPLVVFGGDNGSQDPKLLMAIMDRKEENERQRHAAHERLVQLMKKFDKSC